MILAKIRVTDVRAYPFDVLDIPKGFIGGQVQIEYADPMWDGLTKTVVFRTRYATKDVVDAGELVTIPPEVLDRSGDALYVGVYGTNASDGLAVPTVWADLGRIRDAADPSGDESTDPSLPVWAQLEGRIKNLEEQGGEGGSGGSDMPTVTEADNGKVAMVVDGKWAAVELPAYDGEYVITPSTEEAQTLLTAQTFVDSNIKIEKVPYAEVTNNSGGKTVTIGGNE